MTTEQSSIHEYWTDIEKVKNHKGEYSEATLLIMMLSFEYTKSDGCIVVSDDNHHTEIIFQNGSIVDVVGLGNLLPQAVEKIPKGLRLGDFIGLGLSKGMGHADILKELQKNIALSIHRLKMDKIETQPFVRPKIPMKLGLGILKLMAIAIEESFLVHSPKRIYQKELSAHVFVQLPEGIRLTGLGLPPVALRMVRGIRSETLLRDIVDSKSEWCTFYLLHLFGLVQIEPSEQTESSKLSQLASRDSKKLAKLRDWFKENKAKKPHQLLAITEAKEVNKIIISQKSRKLSSSVHPDRFVSFNEEVQAMAARCFELVSAAEQALDDEEYMKELKAELDAKARGEVYVSESSEKKSHLLYEKAKFLFRRNKLDEARDLVDRAYELNPYYWRLNYLRLSLFHKQKSMPSIEIADQLTKIEGCKGHERLDILTMAAELYSESSEQEYKNKANEIPTMVRGIDPEFQRAKILRRKLNKNSQQNSKENTSEKSTFFSSLFKRK